MEVSHPATHHVSFHDVTLSQGVIRYRDLGSGPPLVFVHGILANSVLWRDVVPALAGRFRCIVPDLPLGGHVHPLRPDADRTPVGIARLLADFLAALDLHDVTLVGNDTGGAICQLCIARHSERIGALVLTNCDAYEAFFPLAIQPFHHSARLFGDRFGAFLARTLHWRLAQRLLLGLVSLRRFDAATLNAYYTPFLTNPGVRHDLIRFLASVSNRYTLDAAVTFPTFPCPVLIVWGRSDIFFSARNARRLQRDFPNATLTFLPHARAFVPEDQPERLAALIADFVPTVISG